MSAIKRAAVFGFLGLAMTANAVSGLYGCICPDDHTRQSDDTEVACDDHAEPDGQDHDTHSDFRPGAPVQPQIADGSRSTHEDGAGHADCPPACMIACVTANSPAFPAVASGQLAASAAVSPLPPSSALAPDPAAGPFRPPRPDTI
jgi:hypothetical protein